jgi:hypothetical protein
VVLLTAQGFPCAYVTDNSEWAAELQPEESLKEPQSEPTNSMQVRLAAEEIALAQSGS